MKNIKAVHTLVLTLVASGIVLVGCASFRGERSPSSLEQVWFTTVTNYIQELVTQASTNFIVRAQPDGTLVTNAEVVTTVITNTKPVYVLTPSQEGLGDAQAIGQIVEVFAPGAGTILGAILAGGLGVWARMRSYKKSGTVLVQNIEAIREFIKTNIPEGQKYDAALVKWLSENQKEQGAVHAIMALLDKYVTNKNAKVAAQEIKTLLESLNPRIPPSSPQI